MHKKFSSSNRGGAFTVLKGAILSLILYPAVALAAGIICYNTKDPTASVGLYAIFSFVISGAMAGFINAKLYGRGGVAIPILSALAALAVYFIASIIVGSGGFSVYSVTCAALYFLAAALFALIGSRGRQGRKRKIRFGK